MLWSIRNPQRLLEERQAIDRLHAEEWLSDVEWQFAENLLAVDATITAHGHRYEVRLTYPEHFPLVPPFVLPRDKDAYWSRHQYGPGGSLCLELRPDNWNPAATGADMLQSAFNLLDIENPLGSEARMHAPSAHQPWPAWAASMSNRLVLVDQRTLDRLRQGSSKLPMWCRWFPTGSFMASLIHDEVDSESHQIPPIGKGILLGCSDSLEVVCSAVPAPERIGSRAVLAELLQIDLTSYPEDKEVAIIVLLREGQQLLSGKGDGPFTLWPMHVMSDDVTRRKAAIASERPLKIGLVGAGSVGSKIAESLVRAGIAELVVADGDIMLPGNIARHALDWWRVGVSKAQGLAEHLQLISPGLQVETINVDLRWQQSTLNYSQRLNQLTECHILIDATGDHPTRLMLAAMAEHARIPFLSVSVFEGGIGAWLAPCLPSISPPFAVAHPQYEAYCRQESEKRQVVVPVTAGRPYEGALENGEPMLADDADVSMAAAHASRLVLDMLARPEDPVLARWLLLGFRKKWIFDGHGYNHLIDLGTYTLPSAALETEKNQGMAFLLEILSREAGVETPAD